MINAWTLFTSLAKASGRFDTKEHFVDYLEAMKLSDPPTGYHLRK